MPLQVPGVPLELRTLWRLIGAFTHNVPPWKGAFSAPIVLWKNRPFLAPIRLTVVSMQPEPALALGWPLMLIEGVQPSEFTLPWQYVCGCGQSNLKVMPP